MRNTRFWKWSKTGKKQSDNGKKVEVIFMDLSKAFDTFNHSLLLANLKAYGFSDQALSLLQSYRCNRFQGSIINASFSSWNEVITGVPQGLIVDPLRFNIFLNKFLFISKCWLCKKTPSINLEKICRKLKAIWKWISWF